MKLKRLFCFGNYLNFTYYQGAEQLRVLQFSNPKKKGRERHEDRSLQL